MDHVQDIGHVPIAGHIGLYIPQVNQTSLTLCILQLNCASPRMVQTIFWLPNHLKQNQMRLEAIAKQYGKDLDPEERAEIEKIFKSDGPLTEEHLNQLLENVKDDTEPKKGAIPAAKPEQKKEK